jgi:Kef-type K+ transport system membrane component KefB
MLGILLNTRGLVELVVLNIGLDLGILSPAVFSILVLMALITTFMTSPLVRSLRARGLKVAEARHFAGYNEPQQQWVNRES